MPVRADARGRVKGIVHDASGSGQTLFVEPLVVVELGNAWREAQAAVDEEVGADPRRAVRARRRRNATMLRETLEALAEFDFWAAKAQLAAEMDGDPRRAAERPRSSCCRPATRGSPGASCRSTSGSATATRRWSSPGPNTGGKTVALRRSGCSR